jgi:outer membrane autotransporter protein
VSVATALQQLCDQLSNVTNGAGLGPQQQDLLRSCAFFQDPQASPAALSSGYAAIMGQQLNALGPQAKKFASLQQDNLAARMSQLRHDSGEVSLSGLQLRGDDNRLLAANDISDFLPEDGSGSSKAPAWWDNRLGLFVNGNVKNGSKRHSQNSFAFDIKDTSFTVGADYRVTDWLVLGADFASGHARTLFADDLGRLDLKADGGSVFALAYARSFYLDVLAGYGGINLHTTRNLDFTQTTGTVIDQQALGASHIEDMWAGMSLGDDLTWGPFVVTPEGSLNWHEIRLRGFTESMSAPAAPGNGLALSYGDAVVPSMQARLTLQMGYTWSTSWGVIVPHVHASFIREFRNRADTFTARFAAAAAQGVTDPAYIRTDAPEGHYWANGGGFTAHLGRGLAAFFDYEQLKTLKTIKSHEFSVGVRYEFRH